MCDCLVSGFVFVGFVATAVVVPVDVLIRYSLFLLICLTPPPPWRRERYQQQSQLIICMFYLHKCKVNWMQYRRSLPWKPRPGSTCNNSCTCQQVPRYLLTSNHRHLLRWSCLITPNRCPQIPQFNPPTYLMYLLSLFQVLDCLLLPSTSRLGHRCLWWLPSWRHLSPSQVSLGRTWKHGSIKWIYTSFVNSPEYLWAAQGARAALNLSGDAAIWFRAMRM